MLEVFIRQIAHQRETLLGFLADVEGDAWSRPTVCTGWSIKDVLAHLTEGELNVGRIYRREVREQPRIDPEEGIAKWRPLPGAAVRSSFWQHGTATQRALEQVDDEAWRAPIRAYGCRRIGQLVRIHLFDLSVHGHDLTDALGATPLWDPALAFLTEYVVRAAPPTFARRGLEPAGAITVVAGDRSWVVTGEDGIWRVDHDPGSAHTRAVVRAAPEDLVLLTTGRADDATAGRIELDGDVSLAERILESWRVV